MAESMYRYTAIGEPIGAGEDDYYYNMSSSFRTTEPPMTEDEALLYGQKYFTYAETVSAATAAILIYLIPNLYIKYAECRLTVEQQQKRLNDGEKDLGASVRTIASISTVEEEEEETPSNWESPARKKNAAMRLLRSTLIWNCSLGCFLYVVTTVVVSMLTYTLDNRANSVVVGLSQLFAGLVFCWISLFSIPRWLGMRCLNIKQQPYKHRFGAASTTTSSGISFIRQVRRILSRNLWREFLSMYFFNMYFSCANNGTAVIFGVLVGFPSGMIVMYFTRMALQQQAADAKDGAQQEQNSQNGDDNKHSKTRKRKARIGAAMMVLFAVGSYAAVVSGDTYICKVWLPHQSEEQHTWNRANAILWALVLVGLHALRFFFRSECDKKIINGNHYDDMVNGGDNKNVNDDNSIALTTVANTTIITDTQAQQQEQPFHHAGIDNEDDTEMELGKYASKGISEEQQQQPSHLELTHTKVTEAFASQIHNGDDDNDKDDTTSTSLERTIQITTRLVWYFFSFVFFFLTIINIGATFEQRAAYHALGPAFDILYPPDFQNGTMCAWDSPGPSATIRTFDTLQSVYESNYTVIHCGSCGACSNWNDIGLQYTTREVLAAITKVCAKKSLFGTFEDVIQCNELLVGFTRPCSEAWAWDEVHTKNNAIFTFLQASMTNAMFDMEVSFTDITLATIDEAISGPTFVPWVGATRRRMNIVSDIQRPSYQQCAVAEHNWTQIFPDPFVPPVGGTYRVQPPPGGGPAYDAFIPGQDSFSL